MPAAESEPTLDAPASISSREIAAPRDSRRERVRISQDVAAAVAHELRTPVFGIASAAQLLRYRVADDPLIEKNIGRILRDAERLNLLVAALVAYARPTPIRLAPCDPDDVWLRALASHRGTLESKALMLHHAAAVPRATCNIDADQLAEACANILLNAIEASSEGGDIAVESRILADGSWRSWVRNDGPSISPDVLARAFEPFVTTKLGHAGIGLAVANRILIEHGGSVDIESGAENGGKGSGGTTVVFTLPAARHA